MPNSYTLEIYFHKITGHKCRGGSSTDYGLGEQLVNSSWSEGGVVGQQFMVLGGEGVLHFGSDPVDSQTPVKTLPSLVLRTWSVKCDDTESH